MVVARCMAVICVLTYRLYVLPLRLPHGVLRHVVATTTTDTAVAATTCYIASEQGPDGGVRLQTDRPNVSTGLPTLQCWHGMHLTACTLLVADVAVVMCAQSSLLDSLEHCNRSRPGSEHWLS